MPDAVTLRYQNTLQLLQPEPLQPEPLPRDSRTRLELGFAVALCKRDVLAQQELVDGALWLWRRVCEFFSVRRSFQFVALVTRVTLVVRVDDKLGEALVELRVTLVLDHAEAVKPERRTSHLEPGHTGP